MKPVVCADLRLSICGCRNTDSGRTASLMIDMAMRSESVLDFMSYSDSRPGLAVILDSLVSFEMAPLPRTGIGIVD